MLENLILVFAVLFDFFAGYIVMRFVCRTFGASGRRAERRIGKTEKNAIMKSTPLKDNKRPHLQTPAVFLEQKVKKSVLFGEKDGKAVRFVIQ